jgi:enoyl-CoA hydratase
MTFENVLVEKKGKVAVVMVNRPQALNALNTLTLSEIGQAFAELAEDEEVRCIVLTGAGEKAFVAGADIKEMHQMGVEASRRYSRLGVEMMRAIAKCPQPVIAAVGGFCLGGGLELALSCDFIYAGERAKLGQPEVTLGVTPGFGATQHLPRRVGKAAAKELLYTGEMIPAEAARELGLVNKVFPQESLMEETMKTAEKIAANAAYAVAQCKRSVEWGMDMPLDAALLHEVQIFSACFGTADQKEGMAAFVEKRKPEFEGA